MTPLTWPGELCWLPQVPTGVGDCWGGHPGSRQWLWGWGADITLISHRAKYINVTLALSTTRFLSQETAYMPWEAALNNLHYFQLMFDRSEVFGVMTVSSATCTARALQWVLRFGRAPCWRDGGEGLDLHPELGRGLLLVPPGADHSPTPTAIHTETGNAALLPLQEHHQ